MKISTSGPECHKCRQLMAYLSVEQVEDGLVEVFHCGNCDQYAAIAKKTQAALVEPRAAPAPQA